MVLYRWQDQDAKRLVEAAGDDPADQDLALRVYTSRIIGQDPELVMHGGGNTSVKTRRKTLLGETIDVLHVKGSGWDLGTIEAPGLPGVQMQPLMALRSLGSLSDEDMVNVQRQNLIDSTGPNPSVETLLHAYLPHKFVDHTHATAMLALANLPDVEAVTKEIFGDRVALVPYIMPGFELAKAAADVYDANPDIEGMLLVNHGHFTFHEDGKKSYDLMIEHVNAVEAWFEKKLAANPATCVQLPALPMTPEQVLPTLRGLIGAANAEHTGNRDSAMPVMDVRNGPNVEAFMGRTDLDALSRRGVATPDHVIRTKGKPLVLTHNDLAKGSDGIKAKLDGFISDYKAYFDRQVPRFDGQKTMLNPTPNLAWIPGLGLIGIGTNAKAASIAADIGEQNLQVREWGEAAGGFFPIEEADLFDMEYWSLEQAKLGKGKPPKLTGSIVLVTGGAGAIGLATAKAFAKEGANIFLVDRNEDALAKALKQLGSGHGGVTCDLTAQGGATNAIDACLDRFGGLDILVSNAGAAWSGPMAEMSDETLRGSFELNFFSHHKLAQSAIKVMRDQGRGGQILLNVSKQAVNPGKGFGAYGLPKATSLFLVKQLALELGGEGIRVNGINADRIRSGLLTDDFIAERSNARGLDEASYMAGNLLQREVEAHHVGEAFVMLASSHRTTAHILTVDGGNIEASLR